MGRSRSEDLRLTGVRVLLVDDSPSTLEALADMLEHSGASVMAVDTADAALEGLERTRPDVLLHCEPSSAS